MALAGTGTLFGVAPAAVAGTGPPSTQQLAAEVEPAVQQEQTTYTGTLLVREFKNDTTTQDQLRSRLNREQADGELADNSQSRSQQWIEDIDANIDRYLKPGALKTVTEQVSTLCSGWFATPTGYLVTAAHCVNMSRGELLTDFDEEGLGRFIDADYRTTVRSWRSQGVIVDQSMSSLIRKVVRTWFVTHARIGTVSQTEKVGLAVRGASMAQPKTKQLPARLVKSGTPFPGQDFAVLKVSGYSHLPSLSLGNVHGLQVGDQLYIDGFPGSVSLNSQFTSQSRNTPTFTEGPLSALRTTTDGVQYLQTQAPAYEGNSGGPVLNASGQVIGILIAAAVSPSTGQIVAGEEFVLPSTVIGAALSKIGVHPTETPVTTTYAAALRDYYKNYDTLALQGFKRVLHYFPAHPYATYYASLARKQIAEGHSRTPPRPSSFPWLLVLLVVIGVVVVGAAVFAVIVVRGSRASRSPGGASAGPPGWLQPQPPAGPPPAGQNLGPPAPAPWNAAGPQTGPQPTQHLGPPAPAQPQAGPMQWNAAGPQPPQHLGPPTPPAPWNAAAPQTGPQPAQHVGPSAPPTPPAPWNAAGPQAAQSQFGQSQFGPPQPRPEAVPPNFGQPQTGPQAAQPQADPFVWHPAGPPTGPQAGGASPVGPGSAGQPAPGQPSAGQPSAGQPPAGPPGVGQPPPGQPPPGPMGWPQAGPQPELPQPRPAAWPEPDPEAKTRPPGNGQQPGSPATPGGWPKPATQDGPPLTPPMPWPQQGQQAGPAGRAPAWPQQGAQPGQPPAAPMPWPQPGQPGDQANTDEPEPPPMPWDPPRAAPRR
jgi:serine protease Do